MAEGFSRARFTGEEVIDLLDRDGEDYWMISSFLEVLKNLDSWKRRLEGKKRRL